MFEDAAPPPRRVQGPGEAEVDVEGPVPEAMRLAVWVEELEEAFALSPEEARTIERLGDDFRSSNSRKRIREALEAGYAAAQIECAAWVREFWRPAGAFRVGRSGRTWQMRLTWREALEIVDAFRGVPDPDEVLGFLDAACSQWREVVARECCEFGFDEFIRRVLESPCLALGAGPGVVAGEGCELLDADYDSARWAGYGRPDVRFLMDCGLIPQVS